MWLHLDAVGGIAGDMFAAAILDLRPAWEAALGEELNAAGFSDFIEIRSQPHRDDALTGRRFDVRIRAAQSNYSHRPFREIRGMLEASPLAAAVRQRAVSMFSMLAEAEGRVHGVPSDDVSFHELGEWDSIGDIVAAAWLIDRLGAASWSCSPLPMGSGRVMSAHGPLPLPAPATTLLLEGFPLFQDAIEGERVTPTGAVIVRHLNPSFASLRPAKRLVGSGVGFGTHVFEGISNVLRVFAFEDVTPVTGADQVAVCQFELDDQTPEDLAVALDRLRASPGVLDVIQSPAFGKKGRIAVQIQVLARPAQIDDVLSQCFTETTTLGIRWQVMQRALLSRDSRSYELGGRTVAVKRARRPGQIVTSKVDMDDLASEGGGFAARERLRRQAQDAAREAAHPFPSNDDIEQS